MDVAAPGARRDASWWSTPGGDAGADGRRRGDRRRRARCWRSRPPTACPWCCSRRPTGRRRRGPRRLAGHRRRGGRGGRRGDARARVPRVRAVVGPRIGPECYEFGAADLDAVAARLGDGVRARRSGRAGPRPVGRRVEPRSRRPASADVDATAPAPRATPTATSPTALGASASAGGCGVAGALTPPSVGVAALERVRGPHRGRGRRSRRRDGRRGHQGVRRRRAVAAAPAAGSPTSARTTPRSWWPRPAIDARPMTGRPLALRRPAAAQQGQGAGAIGRALADRRPRRGRRPRSPGARRARAVLVAGQPHRRPRARRCPGRRGRPARRRQPRARARRARPDGGRRRPARRRRRARASARCARLRTTSGCRSGRWA